MTAIIGRSGSGKSTLLKMINALSRPDRGQVEVFGHAVDYQALPSLRRQIGYLVQGSGLFPHMSVRQNICLLAELEDWSEPEQQRRFLELLDMVQLEGQYGRPLPPPAQRWPTAAGGSVSGDDAQSASACCWMSPLRRWTR